METIQILSERSQGPKRQLSADLHLLDGVDPARPAPEALRVIETLSHRGPRAHCDPEEARRRYRESRRPLLAALEPVDSVFEVRSSNAPPMKVIRPLGFEEGKLHTGIVYLHGGGWTVGDFETYEPLCRQLANAANAVVIWVEYRLAPEHPYPAAFDDTRHALHWVHENHVSLGIDPARLGIAGDSSGGNLAAAACLAAREQQGSFLPKFQALIYPCLDLKATLDSHTAFGEGYLLTTDLYAWYRRNYICGFVKSTHWRLSPLFAHDVSRLPPAIILYAGFDPLRDEAAAYAIRLREANVSVKTLYFPDMIHGFINMGGAIPAAKAGVQRIAAAIEETLSSQIARTDMRRVI
ncbi:MAG TPA: alpha/beta hydrolase [Rhizomicrobium sp.]|jgi:acetyl esterase